MRRQCRKGINGQHHGNKEGGGHGKEELEGQINGGEEGDRREDKDDRGEEGGDQGKESNIRGEEVEQRKVAYEERIKSMQNEQELMFMDLSTLDEKAKTYLELCCDQVLMMRSMRGFMGGCRGMGGMGGGMSDMGGIGGNVNKQWRQWR